MPEEREKKRYSLYDYYLTDEDNDDEEYEYANECTILEDFDFALVGLSRRKRKFVKR